jgi:hypothetical protein
MEGPMMHLKRHGWIGVLLWVACGGDGGTLAPDVPSYESDAYPPGWWEVRGDAPSGTCMSQNVWAEPAFDWRTSDGVVADVRVFQPDGQPWPGVLVQVLDNASDLPGDMNLLGQGVTDDQGTWLDFLWIPLTVQEVHVVAGIVGASNWMLVPVQQGRIFVEFGRE